MGSETEDRGDRCITKEREYRGRNANGGDEWKTDQKVRGNHCSSVGEGPGEEISLREKESSG